MNVVKMVKPFVPVGVRRMVCSFVNGHPEYPLIQNMFDRYVYGNQRAIRVYTGIASITSPEEREFVYTTSELNLPSNTAVELGVYKGGMIPFFGRRHVYGIDLFEDGPKNHPDGSLYVGPRSMGDMEAGLRRRGYRNFSLVKSDTQTAGENWSEGDIGMIFIDADHRRPVRDFLAFLRHMGEGSYVLWHDSAFYINGNGREDTSRNVMRLLEEHPYIFDASETGVCGSMIRRRVISRNFRGRLEDLPELF